MPSWIRTLLAVLLVGACCAVVVAQDVDDETPAVAPPTAEDVQAAVEALKANEAIDDTTRRTLSDLYAQTLEQLNKAHDAATRAAEFKERAASAPQRLADIRARLSAPAVAAEITPEAGITDAELEAQLKAAIDALAAVRKQLRETEAEPERRTRRRTEIPTELVPFRRQLEELPSRPETVAGDSTEIAAARASLLAAKREALTGEIAVREAELARYDATRDLLAALRDAGQRDVSAAEKTEAAWQQLVDAGRAKDARAAEQQAQRLRRETARQHAVLQEYAATTENLASTRTGAQGLSARVAETASLLRERRELFSQLRGGYASIRERLGADSRLNRATGLLLRRQAEELPSISLLRSSLHRIRRSLEEAEFGLIRSQQDRTAIGDVDSVVKDLLDAIRRVNPEAADEATVAVATELVAARRDLLDGLVGDWDQYFKSLAELEDTTRSLVEVGHDYENFIDERILWVKSITSDDLPTVAQTMSGLRWLVDPGAIRSATSDSMDRARREWTWHVAAALGAMLLILIRTRARRLIVRLADSVSNYRTDAYRFTVYVFLLTIVIAATIPLLMLWVAWFIEAPDTQPRVIQGIADGLRRAAGFLFLLDWLRIALWPKGLAGAHFRWPVGPVNGIRRNLWWFLLTVIPVGVVTTAVIGYGTEDAIASVGRVCFSVLMILLTLLLHRIFRPGGPLVQGIVDRNRGGIVDRLRHVWTWLLILSPMALLAFTWAGYLFTAQQLARHLFYSLIFIGAIVVLDGMMHRWLFIARRRVAIESARRRREEAAAEAEAAEGGEGTSESSPVDSASLDLPAISAQTKHLFETAIVITLVVGLFVMWRDVLPALRMFDRMQLYPRIELVQHTPPTAEAMEALVATPPAAPGEGKTAPSSPVPGLPSTTAAPETGVTANEPLTITLADLGGALIVLAVTWILFRNVPGVVDIIVLQRLPLDAGSRYALSTVLRYCIAIVGVVIAFGSIGIAWGHIQWLAAALTFGLAFGLQEIFANFVSGLIILAEQPFRVGDTVTAGTTSGTVTKIQMRATTIRDWNRKEIVIPNKTFITGDVTNWTLSDPLLRLIIEVGVAYGTDTDRVTELLLEIGADHPRTLDDPASRALFVGFGDSTLNFELRVFIADIDYMMATKHDINSVISRRFTEQGIEIAFPQRDLHVRSIGELAQIIDRGDLGADAATQAGQCRFRVS